MIHYRALAVLPMLVATTHCGATQHTHRRRPAQPAVVRIYEVQSQPVPNVVPPTRLDMVMNGGGTMSEVRARCEEAGGTDLIDDYSGHGLVCVNVDY